MVDNHRGEVEEVKELIKKHPQLILAGIQVTLATVGGWSFIPPKVALACGGAAGLLQALLALYYTYKQKQTEGT